MINDLIDYLGSEEERRGCDGVPVELRKWMERVEPVHVHYGRVDA